MKRMKKTLLFSLLMIPAAGAAGLLAALSRLEELQMQSPLSTGELLLMSTLQMVVILFICCMAGGAMGKKLGLFGKSLPDKGKIRDTLILSCAVGIFLSLDYWIFGTGLPSLRTVISKSLTPAAIGAGVFYDGMAGEILGRLVLMNLMCLLFYSMFPGKNPEGPSKTVLIAGNVVSALMFASLQVPASAAALGEFNNLVLLRCFFIQGTAGLVFGRIYRKNGIVCAVLGHGLAMLLCSLIWLVSV